MNSLNYHIIKTKHDHQSQFQFTMTQYFLIYTFMYLNREGNTSRCLIYHFK